MPIEVVVPMQPTNPKVEKALQLFNQCDDMMKQVVLHASGYPQKYYTEEGLRKHFDTMDLMDSLDSAIDDMEFDIENSN